MSFSRYLEDDGNDAQRHPQHHLHHPHQQQHGLQLQIPSFICSGPPTLAPGGGAEVLPFNSTWYNNNNSNSNSNNNNVFYQCVDESSLSPALGLSVYSATGFDIVSLLARVCSRPNPRISLGPVDMTCSFVVVDVRRHDHPIVYCSPTFCQLTGYQDHEILGRNCRFLQAPPDGGPVRRGGPRRFTSQSAVNLIRKALSADKEVQTRIVNFRKDGSAFDNLLTVIPIQGGVSGGLHEIDDVVYHIGFQVNLNDHPNIVEGLSRGAHVSNHRQSISTYNEPPPARNKSTTSLTPLIMSSTLARLLQNQSFLSSFPITTHATVLPPSTSASSGMTHSTSANSILSLLLLEYAPDFIHVVSLKGDFLYAAPAVSRVLGYDPHELVGRSLKDIAHPGDVVPLERQLKESSALSSSTPTDSANISGEQGPNVVDVLFRARIKTGSYVWLECRGRLYVEPGKGRKAIILGGRTRGSAKVEWAAVPRNSKEPGFWVALDGRGPSRGSIVGIGKGLDKVLGYELDDIMGRRIVGMVQGRESRREVEEVLAEYERFAQMDSCVVRRVLAKLRTSEGQVSVAMSFHCSPVPKVGDLMVPLAPVYMHAQVLSDPDRPSSQDAETEKHPLDEDVFAELGIDRKSAWQYELQQLKFASENMRREVEELEREVKEAENVSLLQREWDTSASQEGVATVVNENVGIVSLGDYESFASQEHVSYDGTSVRGDSTCILQYPGMQRVRATREYSNSDTGMGVVQRGLGRQIELQRQQQPSSTLRQEQSRPVFTTQPLLRSTQHAVQHQHLPLVQQQRQTQAMQHQLPRQITIPTESPTMQIQTHTTRQLYRTPLLLSNSSQQQTVPCQTQQLQVFQPPQLSTSEISEHCYPPLIVPVPTMHHHQHATGHLLRMGTTSTSRYQEQLHNLCTRDAIGHQIQPLQHSDWATLHPSVKRPYDNR